MRFQVPAPRSYRAHAIVMRARNLGEADRIFTLFTREHGKIEAVAKGIRRSKSKLTGKLEFGIHVLLGLHRGRALDIITDAEIVHAPWAALTEPAAYAVAHLMLELADASCETGLTMPEMYALLDGALRGLERIAEPMKLIPRFEARLLAILGVGPYDRACVHCEASLEEAGAWADLDAGGLSCALCRPHQADIFALEPRDVANFRALAAPRAADFPAAQRAVLTAEPAAARAIDAFLTYHLGKRPKAGRFLDELQASL